PERVGVHRGAVDGHGDRPGVPALLAREAPQLGDPGREVAGPDADREPAVTVLDDAPERARPVAAEEHRRMRLLDGLRPRPERRKADQLALEARLVLGPDPLHGLDTLAEELPAGAEVGAVVLHLLGVPAASDAEQETPAGEEVEGRDLLGGRERVG